MSDSFNPSQWICRKDPRTQRTYYVNRRTGRSTWDPVHRTAVDTEPVAALYQAVVPVMDVPLIPAKAETPQEAKQSPTTPPMVSVPSTSTLKISQRSDASTTTQLADQLSLPPSPEATSVGTNRQSMESGGAARTSTNASSSTSGATSTAAPGQHEGVPLLLQGPATSAAIRTTTGSPMAFRVPLASSASLSDSEDVKSATPLGTSPIQQVCSQLRRSHLRENGMSILPPESAATASLSHPSSSPVGRQSIVAVESNASVSSTSTQRPRDQSAASPLTGSTRLPPSPPPLPLPSLVAHPAQPTAPRATNSLGDAVGGAGVDAFASQSADSPQHHSSEVDASLDQEAAAAEEWRLTRRTWELEAERAQLESELAVLRGPVEVEVQSIAEDHGRLLEAQRALESAATLAVRQQNAKREELDGLRQRLSELQEQRATSTFLVSTLQERLTLVSGRCRAVQDEEEELRRQRAKVEDVLLPLEESSLRDLQRRLADQRQRVVAQQRQLEDRQRSLIEARRDVQRMRQRVEELEDLSLDESNARDETERRSSSLGKDGESLTRQERETTFANSSAAGALVVVDSPGAAVLPREALTEQEKHLQARIAELQREVSSLLSASRSLCEGEVLAMQQQVLKEWTQHLRGEAETWRPTLEDAHAMLRELTQLHVTQSCKYGGSTSTAAAR